MQGKPIPSLQFSGEEITSDEAARLDRIGTDQNSAEKTGPISLIATGGATNLDDWHIRKTIFRNVEIHYTGKPVILEDVVFNNCLFFMDNTKPARSLGKAILASLQIDFSNGVPALPEELRHLREPG